MSDYKEGTKCIQAGYKPAGGQPRQVPIVQSTTFHYDTSEAMGRLTITQPAKAQELRVVWKSPLIPGDPLVWRKNLDQTTKDKIKSFVLSYGKGANAEAEMKVLNSLQWSGFIPSSDRQLDSVRVLEYFRQKSKIQDSDMPADEKKAKIAEIDAAMKKLSK